MATRSVEITVAGSVAVTAKLNVRQNAPSRLSPVLRKQDTGSQLNVAAINQVLVDIGRHQDGELYNVGDPMSQIRTNIRNKLASYCHVGNPMCDQFIHQQIPSLPAH